MLSIVLSLPGFLRYTETGDCPGEVSDELFMPIRLSWNIPAECQEVIQTSLRQAQAIADDAQRDLNEALPALVCLSLIITYQEMYCCFRADRRKN